MIPFGTNVRRGQDISFPRSTVFPHDPSYMAGNRALMMRRRAARGRPFGVPGARVVGEPELGDIGDAIGGGTEVLGSDQEPGFPGGATPRATFIPPAPFPEAPPGPEPPSDFDRGLQLGRLTLGGAKQVASLVGTVQQPEPPGMGVQRDEAAFQGQRAGERLDLRDTGDVPGGATQVAGLGDLSEFDLGEGLDTSFNPVVGGATQVPAADLEGSFGEGVGAELGDMGDSGIGLGTVGGAVGAGVGIAGAILSDRPIEQKAAISAVSAGQVAAPAIAGAIGGPATASTAGTVAGVAGVALNAALLANSLANQDDDMTTAENREQNKQIIGLVASVVGLAFPAIGILWSIGSTIDTIARILDRPTPPAGENWNDYKSMVTSYMLEDKLPETFGQATNPLQLLGFALAGSALAPHGEIQIGHNTWGSGGDYDTPVAPDLVSNVEKIASTGDPALLREYIQGVIIKTGPTGGAQDNWLLTDTYKRALVSLLPASHPVRQEAEANPANFFGPTPANHSATGGIDQFIQRVDSYSLGMVYPGDPSVRDVYLMIDSLRAGETPMWYPDRAGQLEGQDPYQFARPSPLFRQPGELELSPEQRAHYISKLQALVAPSEYRTSLMAGGGDYGFGAEPEDPSMLYAYQLAQLAAQQGQGSE